MHARIPRSNDNDYTRDMAETRRAMISQQTGGELCHVGNYSGDPGVYRGNIEGFLGVAQVPIGVAGPLLVNGEHAQGDFYVPMATTEGTLVGSFNRGMKLLREAGGVTTTIVDDAMQRAPVFVFESARSARVFGDWVRDHFDAIRAEAESTTSAGKLRDIEQYAVGKARWLRFNYTTGDAAGQNMVGKATRKACEFILTQVDGVEYFALAANMCTDKKHSHMNLLRTRGKRVIAEATIPNGALQRIMRTDAQQLFYQRQLSNTGAFLSGAVSNGSHFANGIAAIFIATGQDAGNVAESSAGIVYAELTPTGDYYFSVTIPALIVATYGGGTGLPTQRECLEVLGCYGAGKVRKFAEIIAATVLCGELSLGSAIVADEWVDSHDRLGRNRP